MRTAHVLDRCTMVCIELTSARAAPNRQTPCIQTHRKAVYEEQAKGGLYDVKVTKGTLVRLST